MKKRIIPLISLIASAVFILSSCSVSDIPEYVIDLLYTDKAYITEVSDSLGNSSPLLANGNPFSAEPYNTVEDKYGYSTLDDDGRELYKRVYSAAIVMSPVVGTWDLSVSKDSVPTVIRILVSDHPELFYLSHFFNFLYKGKNREDEFSGIELFYSDGTVKDEMSEDGKTYTVFADRELIYGQVYKLYGEVETFYSSGTFPCDAASGAKAVHDRLMGFCSYDKSYPDEVDLSSGICDYQAGAYGALVKNSAVCSGITAGATLLLNRLGIKNAVCYGHHEDVWHIWNMVEIEESWYHFDITWDMSFFPENSKMYCYEYFLLNDEEIKKSHDIAPLSDDDGNAITYTSPVADAEKDISINKKITAVYRKNGGFNTNDVASAICAAMELNTEYIIIDMDGAGSESLAENAMSRIYYSGADNVAYRMSGRLVRFTGTYVITEDRNRIFINISYI